MDKISNVIFFSVLIIGVIFIFVLIYLKLEKKKKTEIENKFITFSKNLNLPQSDLRAVPRISIPQSMDIVLTLNDSGLQGLRFYILDISLSGFLVEPDFSPKKLPSNSVLESVKISTPINHFLVKEIKLIRIEQRLKKKVMAFQILKIDEEQFEELKTFIKYLDKFLDNDA